MCLAEPMFPCNCDAVSPIQVGLFDPSLSGGFAPSDGKIGARNKTTPTGAETPNAGASPTVKESTDG